MVSMQKAVLSASFIAAALGQPSSINAAERSPIAERILAQASPTLGLIRPGNVHFFGGMQSCATAWQPEYENFSEIWILGFWSGLNAANGASVGAGTDNAGIEGEVRKVCAKYPSISLGTATAKAYIMVARREGLG